MSIPNCTDIIERLAREHPEEWRKAHNPSGGGPETEAFVRRVAWVLHSTVDARFGLNGKRGNYNDLSDDALNWIGEGPGHDPLTGRSVTVIDFIARAGASHDDPDERKRPAVYWGIIDAPGPGGWVKPEPVGGSSSGGGGTTLPAPPSPPPAPDLTPVLARLEELAQSLRSLREKIEAIDANSATAAFESLNAATRASDLKTQLANLPAGKPFPRYKGRVPKAFGGSTEVTLSPEE